jgi:hypothetical protein
MKTVFTFHTDPGHGWLETSVSAVESVGLKVSDFSGYSYRKGNRLYLEEDCDAPTLLNKMIELGLDYSLIERYLENTFVRNLPRIY